MAMDEIKQMMDSYHHWLRENIAFREVEDWVEITVPFLDRHNDHLQIYAKPSNGGFLLSDDGYTIDDLELSGCNLVTPKRRALLNITLNGFGVKLVNSELQVTATPHNFSLQKHNLLQAMIAVNDLFYLSQSFTTSLFFEDVVAWLDSADIRYFPNVKLSGKSGYDHFYDFVIPKSAIHPARVLLSITNPNRANASKSVFAWIDTRDARAEESRAYAILNDTEKQISESDLNAYREYGLCPVPWSARDDVQEELAA